MKDVIKLTGEMKEINLEEAKEDLEYYLIQIKKAIGSNATTLSYLENIKEESELYDLTERKINIIEASGTAISFIYELEEVLYKIEELIKVGD